MKLFDKIKANAVRVFGWDAKETEEMTEVEFDVKFEAQESIEDLNNLSSEVSDLKAQITTAKAEKEKEVEENQTAETEATEVNETRFTAIEANVKALQEKNESIIKSYDAQILKLENSNKDLATELNKAKNGLSTKEVSPADSAGAEDKAKEIQGGNSTVKMTAEEAAEMWGQ